MRISQKVYFHKFKVVPLGVLLPKLWAYKRVCDQQAVESETHFLLHCNVYDDLRRLLFDKSERRDNNFTFMSDTDKLRFILTHQERECAKYIVKAMSRRKSLLYN